MNTEKIFIKNRLGQKVAVVTELQEKPKGLAFVMHGLGGFKEQALIRQMAKAFLDNNYSVVTFDTTNTFGESDGIYDDATETNYYADLEDVISWAKNQPWYIEPFCLAGHSLGGLSTAWYAENHSAEVKAVAPISTVVSGQLSLDKDDSWLEWKRLGYRERKSNSKPGMSGKLKWSHMEDRLKYNLLPKAGALTMPVLLIVGSKDIMTPPEHQQLFYDALPGPKEMHIIEGSPHTYREPEHLEELYKYLDAWIKKYLV